MNEISERPRRVPLPANTPLTVMDRIYAWRDRMLERPTFQRWVARFPLTRGFASRKERALFAIIAGFVHTQVLTACVQVGLFRALQKGPQSLPDIAAEIGLTEDATQRLIRAAVSLDLVSDRGSGRFGLGDLGSAVAGTPAFAAVIEHNAVFYRDLADPVRLLRGDHSQARLAQFWAYAHSKDPSTLADADVASYTDFMAASQVLLADDVLDAYDVRRHKRLLDVGGGNGTFLAAVARRAPHLDLELFDLPSVIDLARTNLASVGVADRVRFTGGSFHTDPLPAGADCITLVRVLLDHDDATAAKILASVARSLPTGGTLLIAETIAGGPEADAYFGFYLMAMGRGRPRGLEDFRTLLVRAGFGQIRRVPTFRPTLTSLIAAQKMRNE